MIERLLSIWYFRWLDWVRCDGCGCLRPRHRMTLDFTPDTHFSEESFDWYCRRCR